MEGGIKARKEIAREIALRAAASTLIDGDQVVAVLVTAGDLVVGAGVLLEVEIETEIEEYL